VSAVAQAGFTPRQFRSALGLFPTGVTVVTALSPAGRRLGVTVNSFTSVSLDPPLISFNLARSLGSLAELLEAPSFVVNVLTAKQAEISMSFARAETDKWACAACRIAPSGNPVLEPHVAFFECGRHAVHEAGDHLIFLGRVTGFEINEQETPLVFFRGKYRSLQPPD
jgi:flavin reductase (DIM6/NTAB) family NADH-FMN oxidoreductase RutF